jgi:hypothetical protein
MGKTTSIDVINALLANTASQVASSRTKTSTSSKKSSRSSGKPSPKKPTGSPVTSGSSKSPLGESQLAEPNMREEPDGADQRLTLFMNQKIPLTHSDGTEEFYDPDAQKIYTLAEVASVMGVTRERVRQIEAKAKKKLFRSFCSMARAEGEHPLEWATELIGAITDNGNDEYRSGNI